MEQTDGDGRKNWRSGERTDKQLDRIIDEQTDRLEARQTGDFTDRQIDIIDMMEGLTGERKDKSMNRHVDGHLLFNYNEQRLRVPF